MERRRALSGALQALSDAALPRWPRPPGALPEAEFLALCTRCDDCAVACPHGAIGPLPQAAGPAAGTPALDTNAAPCHLCDGLPCAVSCTAGALAPVPPELIFFGIARILPQRCFTFLGPECGACAPVCPTPALKMRLNRPVIDPDTCIGCGLCRAACPVWEKAITVDL